MDRNTVAAVRLQEAIEACAERLPEHPFLYRPGPAAETREIAAGLNVDFDEHGNVVGLDIDGASDKLDLASLETTDLPITSLKAA